MYLQKRFAKYEFVTSTIQPPNPLKYPPVLQFLDVKDAKLQMDSVKQFAETQGDVKDIVFNEYDWFCKCVEDQHPNNDLMHIHTHSYTLSWIDFSNRYGFAYQMSNGCVGVLFNDMSIVVLSPNQKYVDYIDLIYYNEYQRNAVQIKNNEAQTSYPERQQVMLRIKYQNVKDFLNEKKYKLVIYFKEYLEGRSISPLSPDKKDSSDYFVGKYFDYIYDESCLLYAKGVSNEDVLKAADARQKTI